MFKVRQPIHQKANFNFSNDLTGKVYNNYRFLEGCSYLDSQIKLSTSGSDQEQRKISSQRRSSALSISTKEALKISRKNIAYSAHDIKQNNFIDKSLPKTPASTPRREANAVKFQLSVDKKDKKKSRAAQTALMFATQLLSDKKPIRKKSLKRKHAFNPNTDPFYSPQVYVRILNQIKHLQEIEQKSIRVNLQKTYKKLIKTQLVGDFTISFMQTVQKYTREIVQAEEMYSNPFGVVLEPQLKNISRKEELLQKINEFQGQGQTFKIHELVKYYCIPSQETSNTILKELIRDLIIQLYQKKSCNRDIKYVLMSQNGQQITHISQIFFSTMQLLIAPINTSQKNYLHYRHLIQEHHRSLKLNMKQNIKKTFLEKMTKEKLDETRINYHSDPKQFIRYRKEAVQHATKLVQSKSKLRLQARKEQFEGQTNLQKFLQQRSPLVKCNDLFTNYVLRKRKQRRQYGQIVQKLRRILDPSHVYGIKSKLHDKTQEQFRKLRLFNDQYDITYNYNQENSNKIILINMIENWSIFNKKTTEQLQKLLNMLELIYGKGMDNINEIFYWQFQEIYETAHGVANQEVIMKFVLNYLTFDEYGQLKKSDFYQMIDICLSRTGQSQKIIKYIIWNYFQKMGLIQNDALLRRNLEIWYEPIKVVYLLLVSIIFGCEYESIQEMINDLIKYDYQ